VGPPVLIPRPETEELVDLILEQLQRWPAEALMDMKNEDGYDCQQAGAAGGGGSGRGCVEQVPRPLRILDVGAGTGAIGLALLKALDGRLERQQQQQQRGRTRDQQHGYLPPRAPRAFPAAVCVAVEPHPAAQALAAANAARFGVGPARYALFKGTLAEYLAARGGRAGGREPRRGAAHAGDAGGAGDGGDAGSGGGGDGGDFGGSGGRACVSDGGGGSASTGGLRLRPQEESRGEDALDLWGHFDLVVSNPPYIPAGDMAGLMPEVRRFEDTGALCGGGDGLDVVRQILAAADAGLVRPLPRPPAPPPVSLPQPPQSPPVTRGAAMPVANVWLEVDSTHPALLRNLFRECDGRGGAQPSAGHGDEGSTSGLPRGLRWVGAHDDFGGNPRFVALAVTAPRGLRGPRAGNPS